jgi:hypothetical protein
LQFSTSSQTSLPHEGHKPQSIAQVAQFSTASQLRLPQDSHCPQSWTQLAQFSPASQVVLPQVSQTPQSDGQLLQLSLAEQAPSPHPSQNPQSSGQFWQDSSLPQTLFPHSSGVGGSPGVSIVGPERPHAVEARPIATRAVVPSTNERRVCASAMVPRRNEDCRSPTMGCGGRHGSRARFDAQGLSRSLILCPGRDRPSRLLALWSSTAMTG